MGWGRGAVGVSHLGTQMCRTRGLWGRVPFHRGNEVCLVPKEIKTPSAGPVNAIHDGVPRELKDVCVVVTRPVDRARPLVAALQARGAQVIQFPTIAVEGVGGDSLVEARRAIGELIAGNYDGLLLTSANAVRYLKSVLGPEAMGTDGLTVFAIGAKTAESCKRHFGIVAIEAVAGHSNGLLRTVAAHYDDLDGRRFLFARARDGRTEVIDGLRAAGASVDAVAVYTTVPLETGPMLPLSSKVDWVTFTSPSAVEAYLVSSPLGPGARVACIGPTTAAAARANGLEVAAIADEPSVEALVEAICRCATDAG